MLDPFRSLAPEPIRALSMSTANLLHLPALPLHAHEVLFALGFYAFIGGVASPSLSARLFPRVYPHFNSDTKTNWDVHVVSMLQSIIINSFSLYLIFFDAERNAWAPDENWHLRIGGYSGLTGLLQSLALGYFLWDLYICARHVDTFGWGMVVHALASTSMFTVGFRPFVHFYCPIFLLHELSTPFLNIHWFCDKLDLTGSIYQAVNGACLILVFFSCRLVWGTYGGIRVSKDVYRATFAEYRPPQDGDNKMDPGSDLEESMGQTALLKEAHRLPLWLGVTYVAANLALTLLNVFWFFKMIQTVRKRFDPPYGTKRTRDDNGDHVKTE